MAESAEHSTTPGDINDHYTIQEEIGRGSFSTVRSGKHKISGEVFAIKCIQKKFIKMHLLEREIKIMKKLKHPHILPLVEVFENKETIFLVLQMVSGGELFDKIVERGNYSEKDASNIVRQILGAVSYLHSEGVVHRDLKPENLLCAEKNGEMHIYVADFGLSRVYDEKFDKLTTYCGSPEYVAPEVLACVPYEKAVDMWSVGVVTYILLTGFLPMTRFTPFSLRRSNKWTTTGTIAPKSALKESTSSNTSSFEIPRSDTMRSRLFVTLGSRVRVSAN